jgi:phosphoglucomutase
VARRAPAPSFLRHDGTVWTTDKDGLVLARTLTAELGPPYYTRIDAPATPEQKVWLRQLSPEAVKTADLAGEAIIARLPAPRATRPGPSRRSASRSGAR